MARNAIRWKFFSSRGDCRHPQFRFEKPGQFAQKDEESGKSGKALPGGGISDAVCRGADCSRIDDWHSEGKSSELNTIDPVFTAFVSFVSFVVYQG
jgi:hypothetical protein